jgi:hypothetical protein
MRSLIIRFDTDFALRFEIENHDIAELWQERFENRHAWPMDDASRFYGLKDQAIEKKRARRDLEQCINTINSYQPIIHVETALEDQDTLNYLHNVFERYHGLLDQQHSKWWHCAPDSVKHALAQLNIAVHRMESVSHNRPRIVCTWFGMPKDRVLDPELMHRYGTLVTEWGGVYLNYVEIGKTLEDLAHDNDKWIGDDAFQPFHHYSADFNVRFYDQRASTELVHRYWDQHRDFFAARGVYTWNDPSAFPYRFKIAQLDTDLSHQIILSQLAKVEYITEIHIE